MAKNTVEKVTEDDVEAAKAALEDGRVRLEQLHDAFVRGKGEWQPYLDQKAALEYAEAVVRRTELAYQEYEQHVRQVALKDLADRAEKFGAVENAADLAKALEGALQQFVFAFHHNNTGIARMSQEARDLGVPAWSANKFASAKDAYLEVGDGGVFRSRNREFRTVRSGTYIDRIIGGLFQRLHEQFPDIDSSYFTARDGLTVQPLEQTHAELEALNQVTPPVGGGHFYRQARWFTPDSLNLSNPRWEVEEIPNGSVFRFPDALSLEEQRKRQLVEITEADARGDDE